MSSTRTFSFRRHDVLWLCHAPRWPLPLASLTGSPLFGASGSTGGAFRPAGDTLQEWTQPLYPSRWVRLERRANWLGRSFLSLPFHRFARRSNPARPFGTAPQSNPSPGPIEHPRRSCREQARAESRKPRPQARGRRQTSAGRSMWTSIAPLSVRGTSGRRASRALTRDGCVPRTAMYRFQGSLRNRRP